MELKFWDLLGKQEKKNLKQLFQNRKSTNAVDALQEIPTLFVGWMSSTLHKMFATRLFKVAILLLNGNICLYLARMLAVPWSTSRNSGLNCLTTTRQR